MEEKKLICSICQKPIEIGEKLDFVEKRPVHKKECYVKALDALMANAVNSAEKEVIVII